MTIKKSPTGAGHIWGSIRGKRGTGRAFRAQAQPYPSYQTGRQSRKGKYNQMGDEKFVKSIDAKDVQNIPIDEIRPNPWNPNKLDEKTLRKLEARIKAVGFKYPITVRPQTDDQGTRYYELIAGEHRWTVMKRLGAKFIPGVTKEMTDLEARIETINENYMRGNPVPVKLAGLIHELNRTYGVEDLEGMLPYTATELRDSLELLKLPPDMDRIVESKVATEKRLQPIFVSATIYKDDEEEVQRGLYEVIQQAMLESEATFCTIKVKIECGPEKKDMVVTAIQNLKEASAEKDYSASEDAPHVVRFALFDDQFQIVDAALEEIIESQEITKNARGRALELMAADYLAGRR